MENNEIAMEELSSAIINLGKTWELLGNALKATNDEEIKALRRLISHSLDETRDLYQKYKKICDEL